MAWHTLVEECECQSSNIVIHDEDGEDCNAYEAKHRAMQEREVCDKCGKLPTYGLVRTKEFDQE